ncbi:MAG: circularly permuted type 2 ATP-grasp protein [Betaproteobacteria bacterium]|nr:MAG: circularly permuted type 2 ATP-grasp protein [Betaproteobacteria bacterium]
MHSIKAPPAHHFDEMLLSQTQSQSASSGSSQSQRQSSAAGAERFRPHYAGYADWLQSSPEQTLTQRRAQADLLFRRIGITFTVYGEEGGTERLIPSDVIPRIITAEDWAYLERGLTQRVTAINKFLADIYHDQAILKAGLIPREQIMGNAQFQTKMVGVKVPHDTYVSITGVDIVRNNDGKFYVLEDNLRVPSGVSYMLMNRKMMMRLFPELFLRQSVRPVEHYPALLLQTLKESSNIDNPTVVLMTPGRFNSAYFEHTFLAQQMGIELVEGQDLFVKDDFVYMRTTSGPQRVDVMYRRVDDVFLDPNAFREDSVIGVPGLFEAYRKGNIVICNAIGTGVADDKSIYPYVPDMIKFYLDEEPILNNVPTYQCRKPTDLSYVLANMKDLVVKEVHGAGGYGMLVGPAATAKEVAEFAEVVKANPANYIAQPTLALSSCPTFVESGIAPRHIDLRPFVLTGREVRMAPGGLTRVALREGSLVVNSSQGGGTKDTWVLADAGEAV